MESICGRILDPHRGYLRKGCIVLEDGSFSGFSEKPVGHSLELGERLIVPGLVDHHAHPTTAAILESSVDLSGVTSVEEMVSQMRESEDEVVVGFGWNDGHMDRWPTPEDLEKIDRPAVAIRACLHYAVSNSSFHPKREFREGEIGMVFSRILGLQDPRVLIGKLREVMARLRGLGITGVHDMHVRGPFLDMARELEELGIKPFSDPKGSFGRKGVGLKLFADGSLGARTAALSEPYSDDPGNPGSLLLSSEEISDLAWRAFDEGKEVAIHAIGDRAIDEVLGADLPEGTRIEHASVVRPDQIEEIREKRLVVSTQPVFVLEDMGFAPRRLGRRIAWAYRIGSLLRVGIPLIFGTDFPVSRPDPRIGLEISVLGTALGRPAPWFGNETIDLVEALRAYSEPWVEGEKVTYTIFTPNLLEDVRNARILGAGGGFEPPTSGL